MIKHTIPTHKKFDVGKQILTETHLQTIEVKFLKGRWKCGGILNFVFDNLHELITCPLLVNLMQWQKSNVSMFTGSNQSN